MMSYERFRLGTKKAKPYMGFAFSCPRLIKKEAFNLPFKRQCFESRT